jgi:hypothetical protein
VAEVVVAPAAAKEGSMSPDDEDEGFAGFADEFEQHTKAIYQLVANYMDDLEIPEGLIAEVLLHMAVNMRMVAYAIEAEKPSVAGLKIDLDRLRNEMDQLLRESKKGAEAFIASAKSAIADAEKEAEEE